MDKKMKRQMIIQIGIVLILLIIVIAFIASVIINPKQYHKLLKIKKKSLSEGKTVTKTEINLGEYDSNITLIDGGEYNLTGTYKSTLIINSTKDVVLNLNGVSITNSGNAAIVNKGEGTLTIRLAKGTTNSLTDGGLSVYDGCIYSKNALTIEGEGYLRVTGNQEKGIVTESNDITINGGNINIESEIEGIKAGGDKITINDGQIRIESKGKGMSSNKDLIINGGNIYNVSTASTENAGSDIENGYTTNGGTIVISGTDVLDKPKEDSKQKSVYFDLSEPMPSGTVVVLKNEQGQTMETFKSKTDFKKLIISNSKLISGTYYLYKDQEKTQYEVKIP